MRRLPITVLTVLSLVVPVLGQPLADQVPEDAMLYLAWCGADSLPPEYAQSHLKALLDASRIRELFTQFLPQAGQKLIEQEPGSRQAVQMIQALSKPLWKYPTAIYFAGMDTRNFRRPTPRLAVICRAGNDAESVQQQLAKLLAQAGDADDAVRAFRREGLVGLLVGYADEAEALAGDARRDLLHSPAFVAAMKRQPHKQPVSVVYVDFERVIAMIEQLAQQQDDVQAQQTVPKVIDALGLRGLKRLIRTSGFDGPDWLTQTFIEAPAPRKGLLEGLSDEAISPELLKAIPADATFAAVGQFDAARLITRLREIAGQIDPQAQRVFDQVLGGVQLAIAKNPVTDVLEPLGRQWAAYCSPSVAGNGLLGVVIVNRLDDPAKAASALPTAMVNLSNWGAVALNSIQAGVQIRLRNTKIDGMTVYYVGLPIIAPAWVIRDGYLYMGLYPQSAAAGARWLSRGQPSIESNQDFVALRKRLGVAEPVAFSFYDLPETALRGTMYQQFMLLGRYGGFADLFGIPLPEPLLPPLDVLAQHIAPAGSVSWVDDAGYYTRAISPFPGSTLLSEPGMLTNGAPAAGAMMVSILLPSLNRARETANRVKCAANMRQIGQAMLLHCNEHGGQYPQALGELLTQELSPQVFICPSSRTQLPPQIAAADLQSQIAWVNANSDYVYLGAGKRVAALGERDILLYEKPDNHNHDGMNITYADGHVEFEPMAAAMQELEHIGATPPQP
ncbi:hypothetical protein [Fontivita pretiosa]|uniref:hypothetical protein n=1 Tax=Fontivita pretiosa TaxID=2989684 RepID=UPI003D17403C